MTDDKIDSLLEKGRRSAANFLKKHRTLVDQFKVEVSDIAKQVDPEEEEDWHSLTLGWAIAKGLTPRVARTFATTVRYHTDLG